MKQTILISACLLGAACRYDGQRKTYAAAEQLMDRYHLIPICPEQLGGLPTPRPAAERLGDRVITNLGGDVTCQYRRGAEESLRLAAYFGVKAAVLKARSPSCGSRQIYDGTFTGTLTDGLGVTAELLTQHGIQVYDETEINALL